MSPWRPNWALPRFCRAGDPTVIRCWFVVDCCGDGWPAPSAPADPSVCGQLGRPGRFLWRRFAGSADIRRIVECGTASLGRAASGEGRPGPPRSEPRTGRCSGSSKVPRSAARVLCSRRGLRRLCQGQPPSRKGRSPATMTRREIGCGHACWPYRSIAWWAPWSTSGRLDGPTNQSAAASLAAPSGPADFCHRLVRSLAGTAAHRAWRPCGARAALVGAHALARALPHGS